MPLDIAFWNKVDATGPCWLWTAATQTDGYGSFRSKLAHRVAWELLIGPPPPELDHICRVKLCVNPDHLEPVTHRTNIQRGAVWNRNKPLCHRGHELTKRSNGKRRCYTCEKEARHAARR